ncbi:SUF system NifU family Fe-S cluster assembly protein [SAR202 cluster bacterium AC-647-N09_OGT_505m]|nr:SUF system NifU family Fe-S cluster assembly protein [SAR202 cluster bacterium AC-647-N09_OGT_505m]
MSTRAFDFADVDDLYQEIILDHYRSPRNQEKLAEVDLEAQGMNPFCGDEVVIQIKLIDGLVDAVSFKGAGCSISQASASILTDAIKGKTLHEAEVLYLSFRDMMYRKSSSEEEMDELGEAGALAGVRKFPIRVKCALLAWATLSDAIGKHPKE